MQPHQQRVVDEKSALDEKITALSAFIEKSPVFKGLPPTEKSRLDRQLRFMGPYSEVLDERIANF